MLPAATANLAPRRGGLYGHFMANRSERSAERTVPKILLLDRDQQQHVAQSPATLSWGALRPHGEEDTRDAVVGLLLGERILVAAGLQRYDSDTVAVNWLRLLDTNDTTKLLARFVAGFERYALSSGYSRVYARVSESSVDPIRVFTLLGYEHCAVGPDVVFEKRAAKASEIDARLLKAVKALTRPTAKDRQQRADQTFEQSAEPDWVRAEASRRASEAGRRLDSGYL